MSRSGHKASAFRVSLRVLAATATALSLMASVSPAQAATRATSKVSATLAPATLLPHSTAVITGKVTPRGNGAVQLERYVKGSWVKVSHKTATKTGGYFFSVKTSTTLGTSIYRVVRGSSAKATTAISKTLHLRTVKTAFQLAAATRSSVASGAPVVVTGTVAHKASGYVMLEMLSHGVWKDMYTGKLSKKSTFSFSHVLATGTYAIRVRKPASLSIASGVSKAIKVTVAAPLAAPSAAVTLSGHLVRTGVYSGPVTATISTIAPANVASLTYSLDHAAAKAYTAPVVVSSVGAHTLVATVTDGLGRTATATSTWTTSSLQAQAVLPTAVINLVGTASTGTSYIGAVTASIVAADAGGPGVASVAYTFDTTSSIPYAGGPIASPNLGPHTISVTVTDNAGNIGTATRTWSQLSKADTTKPTGTVTLTGSLVGTSYSGAVTVTLAGQDTGSGVGSIAYTLDGAAAVPYSTPFSVAAPGSHTVVATITDLAGNVGTATKTWSQTAIVGGSTDIVVSSADQATLGMANARLVYSTNQANSNPVAAKQFTFTNTTHTAVSVTSLTIGGTNPDSYHLAAGQATSFTIAPGGSALVSVVFQPTLPTNCPHGAMGSGTDLLIGANVVQTATLTYTTNDGGQPSGSADLSGVNACFEGGNSEPVLDQVLGGLGYTDVVDSTTGRRYIGPLRYLPGTDEIQSPYFVRANAAAPVSIVPVAHYATGSTQVGGYQATGYFPLGSVMMPPNSSCSAACHTVFNFPDDPGLTTYNQNQKLLPIPVGPETFSPTGTFGIFSGDFSNVNFTDDGFNVGHKNDMSNSPLPVPHYLHDIRVFPAYGPGHVLIPNSFLLAEDINRVPGYKNDDFQDVVYLLSNVQPAVAQGPVLSGTTTVDLTAGGTVNGCNVSGFDGILDNNCVPGNLHFTGAGLAITSTKGQLANNDQDNAVYKNFDASRGAFTVSARVVGGISGLTTNYQQLGAFFGTDENNFVKIEIEHNGDGAPHMTMFFRQNGGAGQSVTTIQPAGLSSASTVDLVIKANGNFPDPLPFGDMYGVSGFPLDPVAVYYSINGGPLTQVGTVTLLPANVPGFFSRDAKAGILDSNSGTTTPLTATFSSFSLTNS